MEDSCRKADDNMNPCGSCSEDMSALGHINGRIFALKNAVRDLGCVEVYNGSAAVDCYVGHNYIGHDDADAIKVRELPVANSLSGWIAAMDENIAIQKELSERMDELRCLQSRIEDVSKSLCNSFPAEYDEEVFYRGWAYQANLGQGPRHWSVPVLSEAQKEEFRVDYDRCRELFGRLTEGLKTHNFCIVMAYERDFALYSFTCEGVPGELEITFPTTNRHHLVQSGDVILRSAGKPMQMCIAWRFHDVIPVIDRFFGHAYHLDEIKAALGKFVANEEWRGMLHRKFVVGRNEDGSEKVVEGKWPEYYRERVVASIRRAAEECRKTYA